MKTIKNISLIILLIFVAIVVVYLFTDNRNKKEIQIYKNKIDSINIINKDLEIKKEIQKKKVDSVNLKQIEYERIADSLQKELLHPHTCEETVVLQSKEITSLRGALNQCKKAKVIQTTTIGICEEIIINKNEIILQHIQIQKIQKKERKRIFLKGMGVGGGIILIGALLFL